MLESLRLDKVIFIDIETVSQEKDFSILDQDWKSLWEKKASFIKSEDQSAEEAYSRAGIYAEFGKVICISIGIIRTIDSERKLRIKSLSNKNEKKLLKEFCSLIDNNFNSPDYILCAHNGKEFDFPFLARRILVNQLNLPYILDIAGRKPWEVQHIDTLQLWKFGDYKHYTSLALLCKLFKVKSPKLDLDGSKVGEYYWEKNKLNEIVTYCQQDTIAVAQLLLAFKGEKQIDDENITITT